MSSTISSLHSFTMQFQMSSHVFAVDFSTSMTWLAYSTIIVLKDLKLMALASLKVTPEEVLTTLNQQYTCVGCRRSLDEFFLAFNMSDDDSSPEVSGH